jgi:hypothetical protein
VAPCVFYFYKTYPARHPIPEDNVLHFYLCLRYSFLLGSEPQGRMRPEGLGKLIEFSYSFRHRHHPLFFSSLALYTVGRISWTGDPTDTRPLPTHSTAQTQSK